MDMHDAQAAARTRFISGLSEIARIVCCGTDTIRRTLDLFRTGGRSALGRRPAPATPTSKRTLAWQKELAAEQRNAAKPIHPARLLNEISRIAPSDTVFAARP